MSIQRIIESIQDKSSLTDQKLLSIIGLRRNITEDEMQVFFRAARETADSIYGKSIYLRGLIEFSNYCRNDCYYCGIRRSNSKVHRYRLPPETIFECADKGYKLNFRTIVLQSGEDFYYNDDLLCSIISEIKSRHPDCAVTLSIGEKSHESYQRYFDAGADRYLLRHETADQKHYRAMHPEELSMKARMNCLRDLKAIGYQIGAGFMVGSPYQNDDCYLADLKFLLDLQPHMIGIGPFIPHNQTPFKDFPAGTLKDTLFFIALLRLLFPDALIPATTALGSIHPLGREKGILAGANVVMPNLSPGSVRKDYLLYDGKICTEDEAVECRRCMEIRMNHIGYQIAVDRGDHPSMQNQRKEAMDD